MKLSSHVESKCTKRKSFTNCKERVRPFPFPNNSVNKTTSAPNFTVGTGENADVPHINHGFSEIGGESSATCPSLKLNVGFSIGIVEKSGIRLEQSSSLGNESVITMIEGLEASRIHLDDFLLVIWFAFFLECDRVVFV